MHTRDVIIVGGGINGVSIAYQLARRGVGVTLLEKGAIAGGPTARSCGIIRQHYSHEITARMALRGLRVFQDFDAVVGGTCDFRQTGFVLTAAPENVEAMTANVAMQQAVGIDTRLISLEELRELEPAAELEGISAVVWEPEAGYADAYATTHSYAARAADLGVEIRTGEPVLSIEVEHGRVQGVTTASGFVAAGAVVAATGPWSRALLARCGVELPLSASRVQVGLFDRAPGLAGGAIFADPALGIYVRPEGEDVMLVGSLETREANETVSDPDAYVETPDFDRVELYSERLMRRYPAMEEGRYRTGWASLYDVSPDWQPILDEIPGVAGLFCAVGSSGHGFKLAPAVGEMMAELILDGKGPDDEIGMFAIDRLTRGELAGGRYEGSRILG